MIFNLQTIREIVNPPKRYNDALLTSILNSTTNAIVTINKQSEVLEWNKAAEDLFGYSRHEAIGQKLTSLIFPTRYISRHRLGMKNYLKGSQSNIVNKTIRITAKTKEGVEVPIELTVRPMEYRGGILFTGSIKDLTETYKEEERKLLFMQELNHRIKNLMSVVQAIAQLTLPLSAEEKFTFTSRLFAMSKAQELLFLSNWKDANLYDLLITSTYSLVSPDRFDFLGNRNIMIPANTAVSFSLVIHELLTNALKYGALRKDCPKGRIQITTAHVKDSLVWTWEEINCPLTETPKELGFGTKLINRAFTGEGTAHIEYNPSGLKCTVVLERALIDKALNSQ